MRSISLKVLAVLLIALWIAPTAAAVDDVSRNFELTPFVGYTWGGEFSDEVTGASLKVDEATSYGIMLDIKQDEQRWIELYVSRQPTRLRTESGTFTGNPRFDLNIDYYHIGGTYGAGEGMVRPFIVGTLGVTHMMPDGPGLDSVIKFSMSLGGGVRLYATDRIGFRLEGRWFGTLFDGGGTVFCASGGGATCAIHIQGDLFSQFLANAGVIVAF